MTALAFAENAVEVIAAGGVPMKPRTNCPTGLPHMSGGPSVEVIARVRLPHDDADEPRPVVTTVFRCQNCGAPE